MKKAVLSLVLSTVVLTAGSPGIRPRADAASYPVHQDQPDFSIGAVVIPPEQVKKMFKLDMNHAGYVVVEVGVFPAPGKDVDLYPADLTLAAGDKFMPLRPVSADTVAEVVAGKHDPPRLPSPHGVNTSVGVGIGHASYPDPVTGRNSGRTVTETDAGVGIGDPAPLPDSQPSSVQTANTISQDLWEKSLPDGKTVHAVAGYLYFPKPAKKSKDAAWELRYENTDGKTRLPLPR